MMIQSKSEILTNDSVVLITGGAKGITAKCSIEIAKKVKCTLILVGRSPLLKKEPEWASGIFAEEKLKSAALAFFKENQKKVTPLDVENEIKIIVSNREIQATLKEISDAGANAAYFSADVTDAKSIQSALESAETEMGKITGLIHGAGNLADSRIENKTASDFDLVVNTKIEGFENILRFVDSDSLKFIVLFSSVAGFYGNIGQTDYAIANEILNKSAYVIQESLPNCRVISIDWGPWDSGMVSARLKKFFEAKNIQLISSEEGVKVLIDTILSETSYPQIIVGNQLGFPTELGRAYNKPITIRRDISYAENPFLNDHRIGQQAVLPATCASTWVVDTCHSLHPGYFFIRMEDFKILKGLTFNNESHSYLVTLKPTASLDDREKSYQVQISSKNETGKTIFHYSGQVFLDSIRPDIPINTPVKEMRLDEKSYQSGTSLYTDGTLFHGPSFQGIQKVLDVSENRVVTEVFLPDFDERSQGQFTVRSTNPYINDAVVQSLLVWTQTFYDAPCLPSRLHRWDNFQVPQFGKPLHVILDVTYHNENAVIGDLRVQDGDGNVYFIYTGLEGTISKHLKRLFKK